MERVFADAGYRIALLNPRDDLHHKALALSRDLESAEIITSEMVLTEFLNCFSGYGPPLRELAAIAVASLLEALETTIVPQTTELFARALRIYLEMTDKSWSLTDCASFVIMKDEEITSALTHDRHFVQAGFQALLR